MPPCLLCTFFATSMFTIFLTLERYHFQNKIFHEERVALNKYFSTKQVRPQKSRKEQEIMVRGNRVGRDGVRGRGGAQAFGGRGRGRGGYNNNNWNEGVRNNVAAFQRSSRGQRYQNTNYALRPSQKGGYNQSIKSTFRPAANGGMRGNRQQRGRGIINRIGKRGGSRGGGGQRGGGQRGGVQSGGGGRGGQRGRGGRGGRGKPTMDQLDSELEKYMGEDATKARLDRQLENYFTESVGAEVPVVADVAMAESG
eukprot:GHVN01098713.1.p1 GENE.GHVN01098713.1~~GHVN01098713.1.p1  ORF type:complete len:254 (+),score=28.24 GHVN01098713.1:53-814(+)